MAFLGGLGKIFSGAGRLFERFTGIEATKKAARQSEATSKAMLERIAPKSIKLSAAKRKAAAVPKTKFTLPAAGGGGGGRAAAPAYKPINMEALRKRLSKQLGIASLQKQLEGAISQSERERSLLEALPEDIRGRTSDFLMGGARRRRLEASEREPIARRYRNILAEAQPIQRQLGSAQATLRELLNMTLAQEQLKLQARPTAGRAASPLKGTTVTTAEGVFAYDPYTGALGQRLGSPYSAGAGEESEEEKLARILGIG